MLAVPSSCSSTGPAPRSRSCASATSACARKTPDFHAISVLNAILGGTFHSRLNRVIREEKGYSYGIHSSFEMRRHAGPFAVRCAVETAVTVPALIETLRIVREMTEAPPTEEEISLARDYLVGVFPLRFETAGPGRRRVVGPRRRTSCPTTSSTATVPQSLQSTPMPCWRPPSATSVQTNSRS